MFAVLTQEARAQQAGRQAQASADNVVAAQSNSAGVAGETTVAAELPSGGVGAVANNRSCGSGKALLPGEGNVDTYYELIAAGSKGDNITPHHIPSAKHMAQHGVVKGDGIAINMEQPTPGTGGRHRRTHTYGTTADVNKSSRDALASGVRDTRNIYKDDGLYGPEIRAKLQELIRKSKQTFPGIFGK